MPTLPLYNVNCSKSRLICVVALDLWWAMPTLLSYSRFDILTVNYQLSTINYQLSTVNYQLSTINCHKMTKIIVIEDEEHVRDILCEMLSAEQFEVIKSANGKIGIELAKEKLPDLIICDVMMPELDGYGVLEELRKNKYTQTIPFIFLTAKAAKQDLREGMDLGADDYLTKPFSRDSLLKAVNVRLQKKAAVIQESEEKEKILRDRISFALPHELRTPLNAEVLNCFTKLNILDYRIPFSGQRLKKDNLSKPMDITYFSTHTCLQKAQFI